MKLAALLSLVKKPIERLPGAFHLYKCITSRMGQDKVYRIRRGPMKGVLWKRDNRFPYWYHLGLYEPPVSQFLDARLRPGDTVWDIGAHAGYHAILAARKVGPTGRVIAVEPDPETCDAMREQIALNELSNVEVVQAAVSDSVGEVTLRRHPADSRVSTLQGVSSLEGFSYEGEPIRVPSLTLDAMLDRFPVPALVKMDVEGAEALALKGAERLISDDRGPGQLVIEVHNEETSRLCRRFLRENDFEIETLPGSETTLIARDPRVRTPEAPLAGSEAPGYRPSSSGGSGVRRRRVTRHSSSARSQKAT